MSLTVSTALPSRRALDARAKQASQAGRFASLPQSQPHPAQDQVQFSGKLSRRGMLGGLASLAALATAGCVTGNEERPVTTAPVEAPVTPADRILANRPFAPMDRSLLIPDIYSEAAPLQPAPEITHTEDQARVLLQDYMKIDAPNNPQAQATAMRLFNDPRAKAKIPDPGLRAAFAAVSNTFAAPVVDFILGNSVRELKYDEAQQYLKRDSNLVAWTQVEDNGQFTYYFNIRYRGENPFLKTHVIAHEPLHQDVENRGSDTVEEYIAFTLDKLILLQQLSRHPEMVGKTELERRMNANAILRLNGGQGHRLGLYSSNGNKPLFPNSNLSVTSYWDRIKHDSTAMRSTPGNAILDQYLRAIGANTPAGASFSKDTLTAIDQARGPLSSEELVAAARNLRLNTGAARFA